MHFRILFLCKLVFILAILCIGCKQSGEGPAATVQTISTVNELNEFVNGINFDVTLSNGETIRFRPNQNSSGISDNNFTSESGGFQFREVEPVLSVREGNGYATLQINNIRYLFGTVICTSVFELSTLFPDIEFSPSIMHLLFYAAVDSDEYTDSEIIFGEPVSEANYLQITVDPDLDPYNIPYAYGFFSTKTYGVDLYGDYNIKDGNLESEGTVFSTNNFLGNYFLELNCTD